MSSGDGDGISRRGPMGSDPGPLGGADKPRVLVVDDEAANLGTFQRVFRRDLCVSLAGSASAALRLVDTDTFDVALVDYAMPGMDGVELLERFAALRPEMACLLLTAHDEVHAVLEARASGLAAGIIAKPWQRENVLRWINATLRVSSMKAAVKKLKGVSGE